MSPEEILGEARDLADSLGRDPALLRLAADKLVHDYPLVLHALLAVTVVALVVAVRPLARAAKGVSADFWLAVLVITNAGLALRLFWSPHLPQVYFDEIFFLNTANNLALWQVNALTPAEAGPALGFHPCPLGWQYLVSLAYRAFGVRPAIAFGLSAVVSAMTVPLFALLVRSLARSDRAGLFAAVLLAVLPIHLRLAGSAALETASLAFLVAALLALLAWMRQGVPALLGLACVLLAWFNNIRMENPIAVFPLVVLFFVIFCPSERIRGWGTRLALVACATFLILFSLPALVADVYGLATRFYMFYAPLDALESNIRSNLWHNVAYWWSGEIHPMPFTLLALSGVLLALARPALRVVGIYWLVTWAGLVLFYSLSPSCDFAIRHTLDSWRTALLPAAAALVLASLGLDQLLERLSRPWPGRAVAAALVLACAAVPALYQGFIQHRHVWMVQWEALQTMRACVGPEAWVLVEEGPDFLDDRQAALSYEMACAVGTTPRFFAVVKAGASAQIIKDVRNWVESHGRTVFLYSPSVGPDDEARLAFLQQHMTLTSVAGRSLRGSRVSFVLFRMEPLRSTVASPGRR